jgi:hypothetical protein
MMHRIAAATFLVALAPVALAAQDLTSICEKVQHPRVGAWSEFKMVGGRNDGATMRMSVVGTERREGAAYLWLEIVMRGFGAGRRAAASGPRLRISKMRVPGFGPGMGRPAVTIVKIDDVPAMEMPQGGQGPGSPRPTGLENCRNARVVGWESVTVPAGTFRALHIVGASGHSDSWVDPNLPFALVKENANDEEHSQTVLVGHGTGARSRITERPRPFDPQLFMRAVTGARAGGAPPN